MLLVSGSSESGLSSVDSTSSSSMISTDSTVASPIATPYVSSGSATPYVSSGGSPSPYVSSGGSSNNVTADVCVAGPGEVCVAPKQGDLRMVPFAITVAAGSNVNFVRRSISSTRSNDLIF